MMAYYGSRLPVLTHLERQKKEYYCQLLQKYYQTVDYEFFMLLILAEV